MRYHMNPILKKEMKRHVRSRHFFTGLILYEALLAFVSAAGYGGVFQRSWNYRIDYSSAAYMYFVLAGILAVTVMLMIPLPAAGSIVGEKENHTMELLMSSPLGIRRILTGKLMAALCFAFLLVTAAFPFLAMAFTLGGVEKRHLLQLLAVLFIEAVFLGCIGICFSAASERMDSAGMWSYLTALGVCIGSIILEAGIYLVCHSYGTAAADRGRLGGFMLLLLGNPLITVASLLAGQMGYNEKFCELLTALGPVPEVVLDHWCGISICVQVVLSSVLLLSAAYRMKRYYK